MRTYRRLHVRLKKADRAKLSDLLGGGVQPVRTVLRALALGHLHEGNSVSEVATMVRLTPKAVREIGRRYDDAGLEQALYDKPRTAWRRAFAGRKTAAAHYRHGLQRSA